MIVWLSEYLMIVFKIILPEMSKKSEMNLNHDLWLMRKKKYVKKFQFKKF